VTYGYGRRPPGPTTMEKLMTKGKAVAATTAAAAKVAADVAGKRGAEAARAAQRAAKAKTSSDFEKLLMRATSPVDAPVTRPDMELVLKEIKTFPRKARRQGTQNPYEKCLHKLWTKMTDPDWRTTAKAVGVLHRIARDARPQDRALFAAQAAKLKKSRRTKASKKTKALAWRYLNDKAVGDSLNLGGEPYSEFVTAYFAFVSMRLASFTGRFEELVQPLGLAGEETPAPKKGGGKSKKGKKQAVVVEVEVVQECVSAEVLSAAKEAVELALAVPCVVSSSAPSGSASAATGLPLKKKGGKKAVYDDEDEDDEEDEGEDSDADDEEEGTAVEAVALGVAVPNIVACDAQSLVADDLEVLWKALSLHLKAALASPQQGEESGSGGSLDAEQVEELAAWWVETLPAVVAWRNQYKVSMWQALKLKASPPDAEKWLAKADVVSKVGGGASGTEEDDEDEGEAAAAATTTAAPSAEVEEKTEEEEAEEEDDEEDEEGGDYSDDEDY